MAIIYSYPTVTPASGDLIVGTDITGKVTKNFTVGSIVSTEIPTYITGTTNTVPLFTGSNTIGNSIITQKSAMYWLVFAYLFHTLGELCASPVALSFITKLSPSRWAAFMMGAYFAATGLGNKVAGIIGENASEVGDYWTFTGITIFCSIFGLLVILILKPLKRLVHNAE